MAQRHFEGKAHAESYQRYRVSPPQELIDEVLNFLRKRVCEMGVFGKAFVIMTQHIM